MSNSLCVPDSTVMSVLCGLLFLEAIIIFLLLITIMELVYTYVNHKKAPPEGETVPGTMIIHGTMSIPPS